MKTSSKIALALFLLLAPIIFVYGAYFLTLEAFDFKAVFHHHLFRITVTLYYAGLGIFQFSRMLGKATSSWY